MPNTELNNLVVTQNVILVNILPKNARTRPIKETFPAIDFVLDVSPNNLELFWGSSIFCSSFFSSLLDFCLLIKSFALLTVDWVTDTADFPTFLSQSAADLVVS